MDTIRMHLFDHATRRRLRELTPEEQATYQALLDTFNAAEREHGVVDGRIFGHEGSVYALEVGMDRNVTVSVTLSIQTQRRLRALAAAADQTPDAYLEALIEAQPAPIGKIGQLPGVSPPSPTA